jgi:AcrR family transcriptional regulator
MGRHREFDIDEALAAALDLFWRKGFEGTSLTDLTEAMGITRPSLYATFGNKEQLFHKALERYQSTCLTFADQALAHPDARIAIETLLFGCADAQTDEVHPPGCLVTNGALVCSEGAESVRQRLIANRVEREQVLRERLERAAADKQLPSDADPAVLAHFFTTVRVGMGVQAASGSGREALHGVVRTAMTAWPASGAPDAEDRMARCRTPTSSTSGSIPPIR